MNRFEQWLMRCLGSVLGIAVVSCVGGTPAYGAPVPTYGTPSATYRVGGTVTDAATGLPVPGIRVDFQGATARSGADGVFSFTWTGWYCPSCPLTATDVDGAANGAYSQATVTLNLIQTAPGDGRFFHGAWEQEGLAIKLAKP